MNATSSLPNPDARYERPFFIFLTLVLTGMYAWSVIENQALHAPSPLILFTALMVIHLALHWSVYSIPSTPRRDLFYLIFQGLLAFPITYMAGNVGMIFSLYMALIGEAMGLLRDRKIPTLLVIGYYLLLSLLSYGLLEDWKGMAGIVLTILPITLFVVIYVGLYNRQGKAREQAQTLAIELEKANQQLKEYAARVEDLSIANERQRMARELHDTLSQGLAGLILQLEAAEAHLAGNRAERAQAIISSAMEQARGTLTDARAAIEDLRKSSLDDLDQALRLEIARFTDATGIPCDYRSDQPQLLPDPVKETVLRSVAESLSNIANHARAGNVQVNVGTEDGHLMVLIQDDGQGFEPTKVPPGHYGLLGIRERIRLVNGSLAIQSNQGQGTTLKIRIPL